MISSLAQYWGEKRNPVNSGKDQDISQTRWLEFQLLDIDSLNVHVRPVQWLRDTGELEAMLGIRNLLHLGHCSLTPGTTCHCGIACCEASVWQTESIYRKMEAVSPSRKDWVQLRQFNRLPKDVPFLSLLRLRRICWNAVNKGRGTPQYRHFLFIWGLCSPIHSSLCSSRGVSLPSHWVSDISFIGRPALQGDS